MTHQPVMTAQEVSDYVLEIFNESSIYNWTVEAVTPGAVALSMLADERSIRPGGTVSGPTLFAFADVAAYILILAHIGKVALAVTTNLAINFLNKPLPGRLTATGRLIKLGKRLAVCEIHIHSAADSDTLVAQATATYSIPPR